MSEESDYESDYNDSDQELQLAFEKGLLKPGLNTVIEKTKTERKNEVAQMKQKLTEMKLNLPWVERLDLVNPPAPLAPELALQMQEQEVRRAKQLQGNRKLPQYNPSEDPVLNDFRRETMFHRQAQSAVIEGLARLKKLGIPTTRPDDYFAEMAKTDDHMQKVRQNLMKQQVAAQRTERVRQLRQQKKVGKQMQVEATLKRHAEKRKMLEEVKKYRKGKRDNLDFLDDKKSGGEKKGKKKLDPRLEAKKKAKESKFGFGGKKRGSKKNDRNSSADVSEYKRSAKPGKPNKGRPGKGGKPGKPGKGAKGGKPRMGKSRRVQMKSKK